MTEVQGTITNVSGEQKNTPNGPQPTAVLYTIQSSEGRLQTWNEEVAKAAFAAQNVPDVLLDIDEKINHKDGRDFVNKTLRKVSAGAAPATGIPVNGSAQPSQTAGGSPAGQGTPSPGPAVSTQAEREEAMSRGAAIKAASQLLGLDEFKSYRTIDGYFNLCDHLATYVQTHARPGAQEFTPEDDIPF